MNYYILQQNFKTEIQLDDLFPDSIEPTDWLKGKIIDSPPENLTLDLSLKDGQNYGSVILSYLTLFHYKLEEALTNFGIDTIQYTPVNLREQNSDKILTAYFLVNIIGIYDCLHKNESKKLNFRSSRSFNIDESKTNGAKIFRIYEDPTLIFVTEDLKNYLQSLTGDLSLYNVSFEKTENYYNWEKTYWDNIELTGFTKKLFHLLHKWMKVENDSYLERAKIILEKGADPNFEAVEGDTPLSMAASIKVKDGGVQLAKLLIRYGANINQNNLLWRASYRNNLAFTEFLLEQEVDNQIDIAIITAIERNHPLIVKAILEKSQIDRYAILNKGLGYTALHLAVVENREEVIKIMLPYYDLEKCNKITPLDSLSKKRNIRELLGLSISYSEVFSDIDIENLDESCRYCQIDFVFLTNLNKAQSLYKEITEKELTIDSSLMPWDALLSVTIPALTDNLIKSFEVFQKNIKQAELSKFPLQAIYLEYAGAVTDPFDAVAMANGYAYCSDCLSVKKALFTQSGTFNFEIIHEGIAELTDNFPDLYSEIHEYLCLVSFLHLHIALSHFVLIDTFKTLSISKPFYVFGNEHDYNPVLIYKLE